MRSILALVFIATTSSGLSSCIASDLPATSRLAGRWEGTIESDDQPIPFFVDLAEREARPLEVLALADDAGQLRDAFNAASDAVRLVVLLSPT